MIVTPRALKCNSKLSIVLAEPNKFKIDCILCKPSLLNVLSEISARQYGYPTNDQYELRSLQNRLVIIYSKSFCGSISAHISKTFSSPWSWLSVLNKGSPLSLLLQKELCDKSKCLNFQSSAGVHVNSKYRHNHRMVLFKSLHNFCVILLPANGNKFHDQHRH